MQPLGYRCSDETAHLPGMSASHEKTESRSSKRPTGPTISYAGCDAIIH
jgi:hypothetical protein